MKKVSIITTTIDLIEQNRKDYFIQMFESIQNQTYANIEHIIIDGASRDGTVELIEQLISKARNKNIIFKSEPDKGIYNAMNKGVRKASGDYIIIMNSDDYYYNNESIVNIVNTLEKKNADFACGSCLYINTPPRKNIIIASNPEDFVFSMSINHNTMLCKKNLYDELGYFDENYEISADYDFLFRTMLASKKYSVTTQTITTFRNIGISYTNKSKNREETLKVLSKYYGNNFSMNDILKIKKRKFSLYKIKRIDFNPILKSLVLKRMKKFNYFYRKYFKY